MITFWPTFSRDECKLFYFIARKVCICQTLLTTCVDNTTITCTSVPCSHTVITYAFNYLLMLLTMTTKNLVASHYLLFFKWLYSDCAMIGMFLLPVQWVGIQAIPETNRVGTRTLGDFCSLEARHWYKVGWRA